jgi:hypothetical protein
MTFGATPSFPEDALPEQHSFRVEMRYTRLRLVQNGSNVIRMRRMPGPRLSFWISSDLVKISLDLIRYLIRSPPSTRYLHRPVSCDLIESHEISSLRHCSLDTIATRCSQDRTGMAWLRRRIVFPLRTPAILLCYDETGESQPKI